MKAETNKLPLKPLVWHDASGVAGVYSEKTESYIKGALWFCSTLVADYVIRKSPEDIRFVVNYGGRTENSYGTVEEAKDWCEFTHYKDKMKPYVEPAPNWVSVKDALPKEGGTYVVAFSSRGNNFDVDDFNTNTGYWEFYNKEDMVKPKYWMKLPNPKSKGDNNE